jgi:hypothetical protein
MDLNRREAAQWELSHRLQDLAETVQELAHECTYETGAEITEAARTMYAIVAKMRTRLLLGRPDVEFPAPPGRLL